MKISVDIRDSDRDPDKTDDSGKQNTNPMVDDFVQPAHVIDNKTPLQEKSLN